MMVPLRLENMMLPPTNTKNPFTLVVAEFVLLIIGALREAPQPLAAARLVILGGIAVKPQLERRSSGRSGEQLPAEDAERIADQSARRAGQIHVRMRGGEQVR